MGEGDRCLLVIGVGSREAVGIITVQYISCRSRELFHIKLPAQGKVRGERVLAVGTSGDFPDKCVLLDNDGTFVVFNICARVHSEDRTGQSFLSQLVLLDSSDFHLLAVIDEGSCDGDIGAGTAGFQGHGLALALIHEIRGRAGLCDRVSPHRETRD